MPDPDPYPDPDSMNTDPQLWYCVRLITITYIHTLTLDPVSHLELFQQKAFRSQKRFDTGFEILKTLPNETNSYRLAGD